MHLRNEIEESTENSRMSLQPFSFQFGFLTEIGDVDLTEDRGHAFSSAVDSSSFFAVLLAG